MLVHVWWEAEAFGAGRRQSERLALAEDVVSDLLARGYIELGRMHGPVTDCQWVSIPQDEVEDRLSEYFTWAAVDSNHGYIRITDQGLRALDEACNKRVI